MEETNKHIEYIKTDFVTYPAYITTPPTTIRGVLSNVVTMNDLIQIRILISDQQDQINTLTKAIEALLETKIKEDNE